LNSVRAESASVRAGTNLRAWWSVLAEPQRSTLRLGTLFGVFCLVAAVYAAGPFRKAPAAPNSALASIPSIQPLEARSEVPVGDYVKFTHSSEEGRPLSGGSVIVPAGMYGAPLSTR